MPMEVSVSCSRSGVGRWLKFPAACRPGSQPSTGKTHQASAIAFGLPRAAINSGRVAMTSGGREFGWANRTDASSALLPQGAWFWPKCRRYLHATRQARRVPRRWIRRAVHPSPRHRPCRPVQPIFEQRRERFRAVLRSQQLRPEIPRPVHFLARTRSHRWRLWRDGVWRAVHVPA